MSNTQQIKQLLRECNEQQRHEIFEYLRAEFPIHPIEAKLNTRAEIILEAIDRASDLTLRGVRGVITEAAFEINVVQQLSAWRDVTPDGDLPYDFVLEDEIGRVRIQLKMQRQKDKRPMMANQGYTYLP